MIDLDKLPMTDGKLVNDKCKEKWSRKGADGSFQEQSMTNEDTWSMTNVNMVMSMTDLDKLSMANVNLVGDKCKEKWCRKVHMGNFRGSL